MLLILLWQENVGMRSVLVGRQVITLVSLGKLSMEMIRRRHARTGSALSIMLLWQLAMRSASIEIKLGELRL